MSDVVSSQRSVSPYLCCYQLPQFLSALCESILILLSITPVPVSALWVHTYVAINYPSSCHRSVSPYLCCYQLPQFLSALCESILMLLSITPVRVSALWVHTYVAINYPSSCQRSVSPYLCCYKLPQFLSGLCESILMLLSITPVPVSALWVHTYVAINYPSSCQRSVSPYLCCHQLPQFVSALCESILMLPSITPVRVSALWVHTYVAINYPSSCQRSVSPYLCCYQLPQFLSALCESILMLLSITPVPVSALWVHTYVAINYPSSCQRSVSPYLYCYQLPQFLSALCESILMLLSITPVRVSALWVHTCIAINYPSSCQCSVSSYLCCYQLPQFLSALCESILMLLFLSALCESILMLLSVTPVPVSVLCVHTYIAINYPSCSQCFVSPYLCCYKLPQFLSALCESILMLL